MKYGLIGERLGHSFSKLIHNQLFDYEYELKEIPKDGVDAFMKARDFNAINVTIPYKETVIPYLDEVSDTARTIGAVNTVVNCDGKLCGDNTDYWGMIAMLDRAGIDLKDKKVLILGSGGTSKTAMAVAKAAGCSSVQRVSRQKTEGCITYAEACALTDTQVILNTTPCGMFPNMGESAIDISTFPNLTGVADVVYNPLRSKLVCDAIKRGIPACGGLYMLVAQAAFAAQRFVGISVAKETIDRIFGDLFSSKENVVLVGMPGSGKSTVGKALAEQLGRPFIDTDEEIVRIDGRSIPAIFEAVGETGFRDIESAVIKTVAARQGAVIATGGGAVLREENVSLLKENGRLYFLDRPLEALVATKDRPLSSDRAALERRYHERYEIYCGCCDCHVTVNGTPQETVDFIKENGGYETAGT